MWLGMAFEDSGAVVHSVIHLASSQAKRALLVYTYYIYIYIYIYLYLYLYILCRASGPVHQLRILEFPGPCEEQTDDTLDRSSACKAAQECEQVERPELDPRKP